MSSDTQQIELYVNLEPHAVRDSASINFKTYFDHLYRAMEIPMIHYLEQLYNEAGVRAKNDSATTPLEFQTILREFVRQQGEERKKIFIEHVQNGKHSLNHLGTIALLALRELTQSLASSDYELVALAQAQSDAPRFQVQTGITYLDLFTAAEVEAARQMDRNPTYFSRTVSSSKYLENRSVIRSQIEKALTATINDNAIKSYLSLRQHIAETAIQNTNAKNSLQKQQEQKQQQQQQQYSKRSEHRSTSHAKEQTWKSALDQVATTPPLPAPKKLEKTLPLIVQKPNIVDLDQRASPLSSQEAQQAKKEFAAMLKNPTIEPAKTMQTVLQNSLPQSTTTVAAKITNLQGNHIRLEEPAVHSEKSAKKPTEMENLVRVHSDNAIHEKNTLDSRDFLDGQDYEEGEEEEEGDIQELAQKIE